MLPQIKSGDYLPTPSRLQDGGACVGVMPDGLNQVRPEGPTSLTR